MNYKLIAMDMDGTLLTSDKEITTYTKSILHKAADRGVILAVCTGRLFASADYYASLLGTDVPVIASNGAYIKDKKTNKIIYENKLGLERINEITSLVKSYGLWASYYTTSHIISEVMTMATRFYSDRNEYFPQNGKISIDTGKSFQEILEYYGEEIIKIVISTERYEALAGLRRAIEKQCDVSIMSSWNNNIEIMSPGVSKGNSVSMLAKFYGIEKSQIMCFGDNENDTSMIEYAGMGIAMGNATEQLKSKADYITDTNDNDGVAKAIKKYVLEV